MTEAVAYDDAKAGAEVAVKSFGDFQNFHPHLPVLATGSCFYNNDALMVCPPPDTVELEKRFRCEVFKMLKAEGKIIGVITNFDPPCRSFSAAGSVARTGQFGPG